MTGEAGHYNQAMSELDQFPVAVLLAAGAGSRFGGDKLLHPLEDGVAMAAHAARNLREAGLEVLAVVRPGDYPLREVLEIEGCSVRVCADAAQGMGVSLAHGVAQTRDAAGWIVALADMPHIRPQTIAQVAQGLVNGQALVAPAYQGERGHPVGFGRRFLNELLALSGDSGARVVVQRNQNELQLFESDDPGVLFDIDRRQDAQHPPSLAQRNS